MQDKVFSALAVLSLFFLTACSTQKKIEKGAARQLFSVPALANAHIGISIVEAGSGKVLYAHQADKYFVPASNTKIVTCYAAMKYLGDSLKGIQYQLTNENGVIIAGTGDPTLLHPDYLAQPVIDFMKTRRSVVISEMIYDDFLGSGWSWNDYKESYMAQRSPLPVYGNIARFRLNAAGDVVITPSGLLANTDRGALLNGQSFEVLKSWDENKFVLLPGESKADDVPFTPVPGMIASLLTDTLKMAVSVDPLATVAGKNFICSRPVDSLLKPMMYRSDNFYAEQALLMVSREVLNEVNDAKIINHLLTTDLADLPQKPRWADGSGLSRYNLFTPADFIAILRKMQNEFGMNRIQGIFPSGGDGTLSNYYKEQRGKLYAKTGSLSGVLCLSGYSITKRGKQVLFSVLVNNHNGNATDIRKAVETFLQDIFENN